MINFTNNQITALKEAIAKKIEEANPFIEVDGKTFIRYDKIRVRQHENLAIAEFFWKGDLVTSIVTKCIFADNEELYLVGIEGKIELK